MESFYGGRQGVSFVLKATFSSVDKMKEAFSGGNNYTQVWYGEYCVIDNENSIDHGKIYRRTYDKDNPTYITTIRGPKGTDSTAVADTYDSVVKEILTDGVSGKNRVVIYPKVESNALVEKVLKGTEGEPYPKDSSVVPLEIKAGSNFFPLVPGYSPAHGGEGENGTPAVDNDSIKWFWKTVTDVDDNGKPYSKTFFSIKEVPYLVTEFVAGGEGYISTLEPGKPATAKIEEESTGNPFHQKFNLKLGIPQGYQGYQGPMFTDFTVLPMANNYPENTVKLYHVYDIESVGKDGIVIKSGDEIKPVDLSTYGAKYIVVCRLITFYPDSEDDSKYNLVTIQSTGAKKLSQKDNAEQYVERYSKWFIVGETKAADTLNNYLGSTVGMYFSDIGTYQTPKDYLDDTYENGLDAPGAQGRLAAHTYTENGQAAVDFYAFDYQDTTKKWDKVGTIKQLGIESFGAIEQSGSMSYNMISEKGIAGIYSSTENISSKTISDWFSPTYDGTLIISVSSGG